MELETEYSDPETVVQQCVPFPPDLGNAVFTILPSEKYTNSVKLAKLLKMQGVLNNENPVVTLLKDSAESERTICELETERDMGLSVLYGDECRLQHRATGEFLSCCTFDGDDAQMARLILQPDNSVNFFISSEFKSDQIDDLLWCDQPFSLKSAESRLHVGCAAELLHRHGSEDTPYVRGHYRSAMKNQGCLLNCQVISLATSNLSNAVLLCRFALLSD